MELKYNNQTMDYKRAITEATRLANLTGVNHVIAKSGNVHGVYTEKEYPSGYLELIKPEIKIESIDIERRLIHMQNIPDVFLMSMEMVLLKEYLLLREGFPNHVTNSHLFIRRNRGDYLPDQVVTRTFITKSVQSFSGFGPQTLRITCLQEMAALNGPNFLREAYGISGTHAGRYGSYEEYLVEEALKDAGLS